MKTKKQPITKAILTDTGQVFAEKTNGLYEPVTGKTDWEALSALTEEEIQSGIKNDPDAIETNEAFWKTAKVVFPESKQPIFIRLDSEVLHWFKAQGKGYQSRINAVLRAYMAAQEKISHPNP